MAIKKSQLYSSLWNSCDELRGGMDASQYKDYVLVLLFVKYVSDKYAGRRDALLDVTPGGSFADMVELKGDKEIGDKMNKIISRLAGANGLTGVIDVADFNNEEKLGRGKEMVDRLSNLVSIFDTPELDFRRNRAEDDDLLGDAYEYLMRNFATESGKSKGQFYTPAEVSRVMAKVIGIGRAASADQTIYDPTCGSGSLLLKAHDEAQGSAGLDLAIYGQEMDNGTAALAKMNMILHDCPSAIIWQDNSLSSPYFKQPDGSLKTFDFAVANPPFSAKAWRTGFDPANDQYRRFVYGVPPAKNGDYAFLLHVLASLKSDGKGAVIMPHGVLFRGNSEADIRREIVRRGFIKGIIGLPANLFYGTGIPACIIVLDKENAAARQGIFMIDASRGFFKDGNKNRLRSQDIHKIVDAFNRQVEIAKYSRLVPLAEIETNDYNLNIPRYIDSSEPEELQDIAAHLKGGIPNADIDALGCYWQVFPGVRETLFAPTECPGYSQLRVAPGDIKTAIFSHPDFMAFNKSMMGLFEAWRAANRPLLQGATIGGNPKALIEGISESLLETFRVAPLLDAYDVYQLLMNYWAGTMQDDVYLIARVGWREAAQPQLIIERKDKKSQEQADFTIDKAKYKAELIPPALLVAQYFPNEQAVIEQLEADWESIGQARAEMEEENSGEEGLLEELKNDKGNITKGAVTSQLKVTKNDPDSVEEHNLLKQYLAIIDQETAASKKVKEAQAALEVKVVAQYARLTEDEVRKLVVDKKWLAALTAEAQSELDRVSQSLTGRIRQLAERYTTPLPKLTQEAQCLADRVDRHLKKMGVLWN